MTLENKVQNIVLMANRRFFENSIWNSVENSSEYVIRFFLVQSIKSNNIGLILQSIDNKLKQYEFR